NGGITVSPVVDVSRDQTSQNETPLAVNPANPKNLITGNNDWNYNDGCGVNTSLDGGKTWTPTLPNGFLPGITKFTNDPDVPGPREPPRRLDERLRLCDLGAVQRPGHALPGARRGLARRRQVVHAVARHGRQRAQQPGSADRDRSERGRVPHVRQRRPGRQG